MAQDSRGFGLWMVSPIAFCVMAVQSIMGGNGGQGRPHGFGGEEERLRSKALTYTPLPSLLKVPPQTNGTTDWEPSLSWPLVEISDPNHGTRSFPPGFDFYIATTSVEDTNYLIFCLSFLFRI